MKNYFYLILTLLLTCSMSAASDKASAADIAVDARIVPGKASVGNMLEYYIRISGPSAESFDLLLPQDKAYFHSERPKESGTAEPADSVPLYILGNASRKDSGQGDQSVSEIKIEITYYRPGAYNLPEFTIKDQSGTVLSYTTPLVEIAGINPDGGFADIESPLDLSGNYIRVLYLIFAVIILGTGIFYIYRLLKIRHKAADVSLPPVPPIDAFLAGIEEINAPSLIGGGEVKRYVFAVSILFRRYISAIYSFDAAEMTTEEISRELGHVMPQKDLKKFRSEILDIMGFWDLSKFAEFAPSEELLLNNLESTISLARGLNNHKGAADE